MHDFCFLLYRHHAGCSHHLRRLGDMPLLRSIAHLSFSCALQYTDVYPPLICTRNLSGTLDYWTRWCVLWAGDDAGIHIWCLPGGSERQYPQRLRVRAYKITLAVEVCVVCTASSLKIVAFRQSASYNLQPHFPRSSSLAGQRGAWIEYYYQTDCLRFFCCSNMEFGIVRSFCGFTRLWHGHQGAMI